MPQMAQNYFLNIEKMEETVKYGEGFDYIVVVSSDKGQAEFWQKRLNKFKGKIAGKNTKIISQYEDWSSDEGAGQLLGTLYAFQKANKERILEKALAEGKRVAIYHAAGQGKRMAPLSFSEAGNKSAIKLPKILEGRELFTILEAVIFQTQIFAKSRPGRLCVFWSDQIVIPSENFDFEGNLPTGRQIAGEIFGIERKIPTKINIWQREWQQYGILVLDKNLRILQREKLIWEEFNLLREILGIKKISKSLGFFSWSFQFLMALLKEFNLELKEKKAKLDTDFHLWTPLTSSKEEFLKKGNKEAYFERINKFKNNFLGDGTDAILIKDKNLGENAFWWDFGQLSLYYQNLMKLLTDSLEGETMRRFFGARITNDFISLNSKVSGKIRKSIIINSKIQNSNIEDAIIINSDIKNLIAKKVLLYNLKNLKEKTLNVGEALSGIRLKNKKHIILKTNLDRDGKKDWENKIFGNPYSYKDLRKFYKS